MNKPGYLYVASSWRCNMQIAVVAACQAAGIDAYDFRHEGFHWSSVMPSHRRGAENQPVDQYEYLAALQNPIAEEGYRRDYEAMEKADAFVLVLPCGRSAHLELGWAVGQGKRTAILLDGPMVTPELMYKMVDYIAPNLMDLLAWLGVED